MKIFDLHCDTLLKMYENNEGFINNEFQVSLEKADCFDEYVQVYALWIDGRKHKDNFSFANNMLSYFERKRREFSLLLNFFSEKESKFKYLLSIEGGEALGHDVENVSYFKKIGVSIITPVWNYVNIIGTPAIENEVDGITQFGKNVIYRMNEEGMTVDLSHINQQGFFEICDIAENVIVSHSNSRSVCDNPRNITDEQFLNIVNKNGLVGINYYPQFLNNSVDADVNDIISHIYHFLSIGGENNVSLGSDFDGIDCFPSGFSDIRGHAILAEEMLKINFPEKIVANILCENCKNYFKRVKI